MLLEALWHQTVEQSNQKRPSQQVEVSLLATVVAAAAAANDEETKQRREARRSNCGSICSWTLRREGLFVVLLTLLLMLASSRIINSSYALRMTNLDLPQMALQGDTIELSCAFTLESSGEFLSALQQQKQPLPAPLKKRKFDEIVFKNTMHSTETNYKDKVEIDEEEKLIRKGNSATDINIQHQEAELLYAIKWYKDEREFFRYLAQEWPQKQALPLAGIQIDVEKSGNHSVTLKNVSLKTSGTYRCEVSTEAPTFVTKSIERNMLVYTLFNEGPTIETILVNDNQRPTNIANSNQVQLFLGDQIELRCLSRESKPIAQLDWIINDKFNLSVNSNLIKFHANQNQNQKPIFSMDYKRNIRLPIHLGSLNSNQLQINSFNNTKEKSPFSYQIYELIDISKETIIAKPNVPIPSSSTALLRPISLTSKSLDQLAEFATSTLNFTVTIDLIRQLSLESRTSSKEGESSRRSIASNLKATQLNSRTKRNNYIMANLNQSRIDSEPQDEINAVMPLKRRNGSGRLFHRQQSTTLAQRVKSSINQSKFTLKIKCVSRLMHLNMSDELKIKLINKTRAENDVVLRETSSSAAILSDTLMGEVSRENSTYDQIHLHLGILLVSLMINITVIIHRN